MPTGAAQTARARARAELVVEIKAAARRQLAEVGAAGLSLRAIARELGMVTREEYDELELRVAQAEHRVRLLEARSDSAELGSR